jgi:hypothetical protein
VPVLLIVPVLKAVPEPVQRTDALALARLGAVPADSRGRLGIVATVAFTIGVITGPSGGFTFVYSEGILKMKPSIVATVVVASGLAGLAGLFADGPWRSAWCRRRWCRRTPTAADALVS